LDFILSKSKRNKTEFRNVDIISCEFEGNKAGFEGDDIYNSQNSDGIFQIENVFVTNPAKNSIFAEKTHLIVSELEMNQNLEFDFSGAGIHCEDCLTLEITDSVFSNLESELGGAIYLSQTNDLKNNPPIYLVSFFTLIPLDPKFYLRRLLRQ
jgi:hypothetical protein